MELWTPSREWAGQDAILIGGGPSLTEFDFNLLKGLNTIGCNDAYRLGSEIVNTCVFGDPNWWQKNKWELEKFKGRLVTNAQTLLHLKIPNLLKMKRIRDGIHGGDTLGWNYSTGALAINLAISLGAVRIWLLGYDISNKDMKSHWHNHNPKATQDYAFDRFTKGFKMVKTCLPREVRVFNVTDGSSKLDCFEKVSFAVFYSSLKDEKEDAA